MVVCEESRMVGLVPEIMELKKEDMFLSEGWKARLVSMSVAFYCRDVPMREEGRDVPMREEGGPSTRTEVHGLFAATDAHG